MRPDLDALAAVYIYLQWIMTGSIVCVEGGGHFRPNRHAELAKVMFRSLEWVSGDSRRSDMERWTARRMQARCTITRPVALSMQYLYITSSVMLPNDIMVIVSRPWSWDAAVWRCSSGLSPVAA